ncbi:MAG: rRNA adenine N(6)-methyltransferase family protein [Patescibacteria group bacterium]
MSAQKLLSQNFLWSRELVSKLIRDSSISQNDFVLEIGPGKGIITESLLGISRNIVAIETDGILFDLLKQRFSGNPTLTLIRGDFLKFPLPEENYKVFANIPFVITGEVVRRLIFAKNPPVDSYLVVQREAALKFVAKDSRNTMLAILFHPWFDIGIIHKFQRGDFKPTPRVDSCLIRIEKRSSPLIDESLLSIYRDFIIYHFTRDRSATSQSPSFWLTRFGAFVGGNDLRMHNKVKGSFGKWQKEEQSLSKIHRTRTDKDWKKYE